jgi:phosphoserine phosphatase RsbX
MTALELVSTPPIEWAAAGRALPGEAETGDLHVVEPFPGGVLVALIDGLGHGPPAAVASLLAADVLKASPQESPVELARRCHEALRHSRGAVMSLASIDGTRGVMTWVGAGNVEGVLIRRADGGATRQHLQLRGAVLGANLGRMAPQVVDMSPGDLVVMTTDGVRGDFGSTVPIGWGPDLVADDILRRHARDTDDALVLVVRFVGPDR